MCVLFCFPLFGLKSSAVEFDEETGRYVWSEEELREFGMQYSADGSTYFPEGFYHPDELYSMNPLIVDTPYHSDFDLMKLPWESFPQPVKDIMYMSLNGYNASDVSDFIIPFVLVRVSYNKTITVYVGTNIGLGRRLSYKADDNGVMQLYDYDDMLRICSSTGTVGNNAVCYMAQYNLSDYSLTREWSKLSPIAWGSSEKLVYYDATIALIDKEFDFYIYGGAGMKFEKGTSVTFPLTATGDYKAYFMTNYTIGYQDNRYFIESGDYSCYFKYFNPPTAAELAAAREKESNETQKGIWDTLKSIPDMIAEKIKGLFIPGETFFESYKQEFEDYFGDRLGVLYEVPDYIITLFQTLADYQPEEEEYKISFPGIVLPVLENGTFTEHTLIEEQYFDFGEILEITAIDVLYTGYRSFVWLIFIFMLFNLIIRKYNQIVGVNSG